MQALDSPVGTASLGTNWKGTSSSEFWFHSGSMTKYIVFRLSSVDAGETTIAGTGVGGSSQVGTGLGGGMVLEDSDE